MQGRGSSGRSGRRKSDPRAEGDSLRGIHPARTISMNGIETEAQLVYSSETESVSLSVMSDSLPSHGV